jgi:L-lactate dehydrogenase
MSNKTVRITVIGCGNVGNALASLLLNETTFGIELNVLEPSPSQNGRIMELYHIAGLHQIHHVRLNDFEAFAQADFVFYTAGSCMKITGSRLDVAEGNVQLTKKIFETVSFVNEPYIIVLSNPVDVVTYFVQQFTQLPKHKVIGTGTLLDSARFSSNLVQEKITNQHEQAYVVGEHGDSMILLYSQLQTKVQDEKAKERITEKTVFAAKHIKQTQGHTCTGVASVAKYVMDTILGHTKTTSPFPTSCIVDESLKNYLELTKNIAISWFYDLKNCRSLHTIQISKEELEQLKKSAQLIEEQIELLSN